MDRRNASEIGPGAARWFAGLGAVVLSCLAIPAPADSFCLSAAETYYQQLYCEVKAQGAGGSLPSFADFRKNNPTVQALLLKRPARSLGITVVMPERQAKPVVAAIDTHPRRVAPRNTPAGKPQPQPNKATESPVVARPATDGCRIEGKLIHCGADRFTLVGNQRNEKLAEGVLGEQNKMALPVYRDSLADRAALNRYLPVAYRRYLEKMLEIGLGGATMSYGKFTRLFLDLAAKGVNFSQRFDTMYEFLKKDKRQLAVSEHVRNNRDLELSDCGDVSERLIACSTAGRNYIFRRIN